MRKNETWANCRRCWRLHKWQHVNLQMELRLLRAVEDFSTTSPRICMRIEFSGGRHSLSTIEVIGQFYFAEIDPNAGPLMGTGVLFKIQSREWVPLRVIPEDFCLDTFGIGSKLRRVYYLHNGCARGRAIYLRAANYAPRYAGITRDLFFWSRNCGPGLITPLRSLCKRLHKIVRRQMDC